MLIRLIVSVTNPWFMRLESAWVQEMQMMLLTRNIMVIMMTVFVRLCTNRQILSPQSMRIVMYG